MNQGIKAIFVIADIDEMVDEINNPTFTIVTNYKINITMISICCMNTQHQTLTKKEAKKVDAEIQKRGIRFIGETPVNATSGTIKKGALRIWESPRQEVIGGASCQGALTDNSHV